jgi:hypothetical protein
MATSAAAAIAIARRRVFNHFFAANAVTPENATPFNTDRRLQQRQFERFVANGVIREAKPGLYYVDIPAWNSWHGGVHTRLKIVVALLLLVIGAVLLLTLGKG